MGELVFVAGIFHYELPLTELKGWRRDSAPISHRRILKAEDIVLQRHGTL
jgi:hypothetical protein